jgi:hypothetical protein
MPKRIQEKQYSEMKHIGTMVLHEQKNRKVNGGDGGRRWVD